MGSRSSERGALRRELGTLESYALLIGILVGAGIFRVTSDATVATGPSVVLAHLVLAPIVLCSSVAYVVFLTTPLGLRPGGEVLHIDSTFGSPRLTFLAAWLKLVSYLGACAYLAEALALNLLELANPGAEHGAWAIRITALIALVVLLAVQVAGVRWFARLQVAMCAVLAVSLGVLIVPGLFAVEASNYRPFFTGGASGFAAALPPLFFAYAGFEALSQAAGEVRESRTLLPRVFVRGILATTAIFVLMSVVAFGVLPASELGATGVPMSRAAARYLPFGAGVVVTLGAVMAVATSLNASVFVPARLSWHLADEGRLPRAFAVVHATRGTPVVGLAASCAIIGGLIVSGRTGVALGIAVVALMLLYALHSVALLVAPRRNPELWAEVRTRLPRGAQVAAAWVSALTLAGLVLVQLGGDVEVIASTPLGERLGRFELTSLELLLLWLAVGLALFRRGPATMGES